MEDLCARLKGEPLNPEGGDIVYDVQKVGDTYIATVGLGCASDSVEVFEGEPCDDPETAQISAARAALAAKGDGEDAGGEPPGKKHREAETSTMIDVSPDHGNYLQTLQTLVRQSCRRELQWRDLQIDIVTLGDKQYQATVHLSFIQHLHPDFAGYYHDEFAGDVCDNRQDARNSASRAAVEGLADLIELVNSQASSA